MVLQCTYCLFCSCLLTCKHLQHQVLLLLSHACYCSIPVILIDYICWHKYLKPSRNVFRVRNVQDIRACFWSSFGVLLVCANLQALPHAQRCWHHWNHFHRVVSAISWSYPAHGLLLAIHQRLNFSSHSCLVKTVLDETTSILWQVCSSCVLRWNVNRIFGRLRDSALVNTVAISCLQPGWAVPSCFQPSKIQF